MCVVLCLMSHLPRDVSTIKLNVLQCVWCQHISHNREMYSDEKLIKMHAFHTAQLENGCMSLFCSIHSGVLLSWSLIASSFPDLTNQLPGSTNHAYPPKINTVPITMDSNLFGGAVPPFVGAIRCNHRGAWSLLLVTIVRLPVMQRPDALESLRIEHCRKHRCNIMISR